MEYQEILQFAANIRNEMKPTNNPEFNKCLKEVEKTLETLKKFY